MTRQVALQLALLCRVMTAPHSQLRIDVVPVKGGMWAVDVVYRHLRCGIRLTRPLGQRTIRYILNRPTLTTWGLN
jgi:hypothetical protein